MAEQYSSWLRPAGAGLYCVPGDFYIDPHHPVERAVITHAHSDHARPGHNAVMATAETLDIMKLRLGEGAGRSMQPLSLGVSMQVGDVTLRLAPAGHVLGSAQVVIEHKGKRAVISGDYKRQADATCLPFEPVPCDLFITEATFGLPVFKHGSDREEVAKLLASMAAFPDRTHLVGVYGLGKCQRLLCLLRAAGYEKPIWLHGALLTMTQYYIGRGLDFGEVPHVSEAKQSLAGELVLCPPGALADRWSRQFTDAVPCLASGWMRVRARARQRGVELPLVISDHVDWPALLVTIAETGAEDVWVTHGREEALVHELSRQGLRAKALSIVGREDEGE